jgi:hypothetical protein
MWPSIDWRYCPIHIIHDEKRLGLPSITFDLFLQVAAIEETTRFRKDLARLHPELQRAWLDARNALAVSTEPNGLDFKLWDRAVGSRLYSVRVSKGHRAHLRYVDAERRWYAEAIGSHKEMGHG